MSSTSNDNEQQEINARTIIVKIPESIGRGFVWLITFIGFVLAAVALRSCNFMQVIYYDSIVGIDISYYGLLHRSQITSLLQTSSCSPYSSDVSLSSSHKAGSAMGIIATVFSSIVWFIMLLMVCVKLPGTKLCWNICTYLLGIAFITETLQFVFLNDPTCLSDGYKCTIGKGGSIAIASMFFLLLGTICMCYMKPPTNAVFELDLSDIITSSNNNKRDGSSSSSTKNFMGIVVTKTTKEQQQQQQQQSTNNIEVNNISSDVEMQQKMETPSNLEVAEASNTTTSVP